MTFQPSLRHEYRPDIDGLRAVAVGAVVIFHAFPEFLKGGFVGVDIFFVISGFLISRIIFEQLDRNAFTFSDFYSRRIKRIFPALILVLCGCLVMGWFALLDDEFRELGKHVAAGAGFVSNLILWKEAGYFDGSADTKPLLHLWSLGIEEQFYIVWPVVLWLAWKRKFNVVTLLVIAALASYYLNLRVVRVDSVAAFYSPVTRFWELVCGSALAWWSLYGRDALPSFRARMNSALETVIYARNGRSGVNAFASFLAFVGLMLLIYGIWKIDKTFRFPGKWALIPVAGAVLLIGAGPATWVNRVVLSNRVMVWIGLISFPLYLWHWPLLSFARIVESGVPSASIRVAAVVVSVVLAWLTFLLVERPLRANSRRNLKVLILALLMAVVGIVGYRISLVQPASDAATWNLLEKWKTNCDSRFPEWKIKTDNPCRMQKADGNEIALIGDSHAGHLLVGISELASANAGVALFPASCAAPFINVSSAQKVPSARAVREHAYELINQAYAYILADKGIKTVFLGHQPLCSYNDAIDIENRDGTDYRKVWADGMRRTFAALSGAGKNIVVVLDNPVLPYDPKLCVARPFRISKADDRCSFPRSQFDAIPAYSEYNALAKKIAREFPAVKLVDLTDLFCDAEICRLSIGGKLMYQDQSHLSWEGSRYVAPYLMKAMNGN